MAWKTEIPYQNANSPLWTEPLWFSLSVPRWLHFPTKLVSAPLPPPLRLPPPPAPPFSFPHVFLKAEICFSSAGPRANRLSFPCQRQISSNSVPFTLLQELFEMYCSSVVAARLYLRSWPVGGHQKWVLLLECDGKCILILLSKQVLTATLAWSPACRATLTCFPQPD